MNQQNPPAPPDVYCVRCGRAMQPIDRYCPSCGRPREIGTPWYYRPIWILVLTLTVMGPFSIPLVWKSPELSRATKIVSTVALLVLTVALIWFLIWFIKLFMARMDEAFSEII